MSRLTKIIALQPANEEFSYAMSLPITWQRWR